MPFTQLPVLDETLGVYIHWPFCASKCPYCDFNSHVRRVVDERGFCEALKTELRTTIALTGAKLVRSVFFGGGTPSLMPPWIVEEVLETLQDLCPIGEACEITLEANPTSVEAQKFKGYAVAGVNRLSMGIQALDDLSLKALGRLHSAQEAMQAFEIAKATFSRVSFDLIYARVGQTILDWEKELEKACQMAVSHLSLYQLTIEEGTRFADLYKKGKLVLPPENEAADFYEVTEAVTRAYGYEAYEVSNYARVGEESRHNLGYWQYRPYIGIGAGAHGRFFHRGLMKASHTQKNPEIWKRHVEAQGHAYFPFDIIEPSRQAEEMLLMGLRLKEGISLSRFENLYGIGLNPEKVTSLCDQGFLEKKEDCLKTTSEGRWVLDHLLGLLLA